MDRNKGRISTYGAKLVENVTQAGARDILAQSMLRLEAAGLPTLLTVHDEWLGNVSAISSTADLKRAEAIMAEVPDWATGLPVAVEGFTSFRYKK
jgi:DNA polymerase